MTQFDRLFPHKGASPLVPLLGLSLFFLIASSIAPSASAQYQTYRILTSVSSVPAGSFGATFLAAVSDASTTANFKVCFDTGYGSSKVPIVPYNYVNSGRISRFNFDVPASTIQDVPPSAFDGGSFNVSIYSVPTNFATCNGNEPGTAQGNTVTLDLPVLRSVSLPFIPEQNVALRGREPSNVALTGANFIANSGTSGKVPSAVNFVSSTTLAGEVKFVSSSSLVSTIPTTIPTSASLVTVQVCNIATYSYCSNSLSLKTAALQKNPGTLTAAPSPALTTQPVTLSATFGPTRHTVAGAPSGPVTFGDWGTTLGSANLVLDRTATFVQAPTQQFLTYALPIAPLVADFNGDGIPDTLLIDPGTGNSGASLNLLLGTVPSGSFKEDRQFGILSDGTSFVISSAAVADFNGDGLPDIVLLARQNIPGAVTQPTLYTMLNQGDGTFQNGFSSSPVLYGSQIVAGDFNKDGRQDIVIAGALDANETIGLQTLLGDGEGFFKTGPATTGLRTAPSPYFGDFAIVAADFNNDGYPDIAILNGADAYGNLQQGGAVYQNGGKGTFGSGIPLSGSAGSNQQQLLVAPLSPKDLPGVIIADIEQNKILVYPNQSAKSIAFGSTPKVTEVPGLTQAIVGDFGGDGLLDVAVKDPKTIHVLSGDGNGLFTAKYASLSIAPPANATLIAASDQNGDSYADLLLYTAGAQDGNTRYPITLYDFITAGTATATLPLSTFAAGTHMLSAATKGTFEILPGKAAATLIVTAPAPSTVVLSASPATPIDYGVAPVTLTAVVPVSAATGTMSFYNGTTLLGTAPLVDLTYSAATFITPLLPTGTYSFKAIYGGDAAHSAGTSALVPYVIKPIAATVTWKPTPAAIVYGTPLSTEQLDATATGLKGVAIPGTFTYVPALGTILPVGTHPVVATFKPADANYTTSTATQNIVVSQATPTITWKPNPSTYVYGTPLSAAQLNATASTPGTFVYTPALGTVLTVGTHSLSTVFTPSDTANYKSVTSTATVVVTIATPVVTWAPNPATIPYGTALSTAQLDATASTPGTFAYTPALGTVLTSGTQTLSVLFKPKDTIDFKPVTATTSITVTPILPTVDWAPNPNDIVYGTKLSAAQLDATSTTPGTFTYTPALGAVLNAGTQTLSVLFTPKDNVNFKPVTQTASITVEQTAPSVAWTPNPATIVYGTPLTAAQLDATSTTPGAFAYTPTLGAILGAGAQTLTVLFTPTDAVDFKSVTTTTSILIKGVSPTITWLPNPATIAYGTPLSAAQLNATSSVAGTFAYTPALGSVLSAGIQTLSVLFTPTDTINYKPLTQTVNITVTQITPTVSWTPNPSDVTYGTPLSTAQLDATASTAGTFVYTPGLGTVLTAGTHSLSVTFTPKDATNFKPVTTAANVLVGIAQPILTWVTNPATITFGTALSAAQLDATANTPGTFTYAPAIGAVLAAGPHILSVIFKPTDTTDFSSATKSVPITVDPALPIVTWVPNPSTITYGTPLSAAQLDATSVLPGAYTYEPANGAVLGAGTQTLTLRFHPSDPNYSIVNLTRTITVAQARPVITWATPAPIALGTPLSVTQLDATAAGVGGLTLPGTFLYTPAAGTVLPVGTSTLSLLFTPTDAVDYSTAMASVLQAVGLPATITRLATSTNSSEFGQPVTFTATTLAGSSPATGTTNFFDGTTLIGSATTSPATLTTSTLTAGTRNIVAVFIANNSFAGSTSAALAQKVNPAVTTIAWAPNPATIAYTTQLSAAQLDATVSTAYIKSVPGVFTYAPALGAILSAGSQTLRVNFTPTDTLDYLTSTATTLITVSTIDPVVTWIPNPATINYGTLLSAAQLDATSVLPGTYTYSPANGAVLPVGTQTLTLRFRPTDPNYNILSLTRTITVLPVTPQVTWTPNPATITYGTALSGAQLDAIANIPGTFTYTPTLGSVLTAGSQTLFALFSPTDIVNYKPLTSTAAITVTQATPTISWLPNPASIVYGTALSAGQLDAASATPGTFTYIPALGTVLAAGPQTLSVFFTPTDAVDFKSITSTANIVVTGVSPKINWVPNPATIAYGTALSAAQLDATSTTLGTFAYTPALGAVLTAGTQTLSVLFTPTDTVNFKPETSTVTITVNQAVPTITWTPNPATISYGTALSAAQLDATSATAGTFTYTPALGTILTAGNQTITAVFTPKDATDFKSFTTTATIVVMQTSSVVSWLPNPATISYGTPLSVAQLDATSATPGTFTYTPALGTVLTAGTQTISVLFAPTDTVNFKPVTSTVNITVTQAIPALSWLPSPATIPYGTPLSVAQLDATSATAGTFAYTPTLGTVLSTGPQTLSLIFTPKDAVDFKTVNTTVAIVVTSINPTISWIPNPATLNYGTALSAAQLDATASVPGTFTYTPGLGTVLTAGSHTLSVFFAPTDILNYKSLTSTAVVIISAVNPVVTWTPNPATIAYGTSLSAAQLDATSTTPGTFAYTPALGSVLTAGTQTLSSVFTPTDAVNFKSLTTTAAIIVTQAKPVLKWTAPAPIASGTPLSAAQLDASATGVNGLALPGVFTYTPAAGAILPTGTSTLSVTFAPTDAIDYTAATTSVVESVGPPSTATVLTSSFASSQFGQPITFTAVTTSTKPVTGTVNFYDGSTLLGTSSASPATLTLATLTAGSHNIAAAFVANSGFAASTSAALTQTVVPAATSLTWIPNPASIAFGTPLSAAQLNATVATAYTKTVAGVFTYTPALGAVLAAGTQTLKVTFTPTNTTDYLPTSGNALVTITGGIPAITWSPNPATIAYGTALSVAQLDATSSTPGTFVYTPGLGSVLTAGTQTLSVLFTPTDTVHFKSVTTTTTITVTQATPVVTWTPNPATITYGTPLSAVQLDATSTTPGTFIYTPALRTVLTTGTQTLSAVFTPTDTKNFKSVATTTSIVVTAVTPTVSWTPSPATITYGTPLSAAQLDASSTTPGAFTYVPALGTVLTAGIHTLKATFIPTDVTNFKTATATATINVTAATPVVTWTPNPATISYGVALSAAQLNATATTPGTFTYNPGLGTILTAGIQTLSVIFTPQDSTDFKFVTSTTTVTVTQAVPTIAWATPASIVVGTKLSGTQLDATATGVTGAVLPGTFVYTPATGAVLTAGTQILKVTFTPTDLIDYTTASASVSLDVVAVTLTGLSSTSAALGDPAKTITLTGTGFLPTAIAQVNGTAISTTFVNASTLTAIIPAADFLAAQVLQISVAEASQNQTTASIAFLVGAPLAAAVFSGPSSVAPGTQSDLNFKLTNPYPVDLTATFKLSFAPAAGLPNDPLILFASGSSTYSMVIPANSTASPVVQFQGGTIAGTITVALSLEAGGVDVTPPTVQPITIQDSLAVPGIVSTAVTRSGNNLTVVIHGFSNPRDMTGAKFHFTPVPGGSIGTEDVTIDVGPIFTTWYANSASSQYGSEFTYTQIFNLTSDASVVGRVTVTLVNSVGGSPEANTP